jgi:hypothetical protein
MFVLAQVSSTKIKREASILLWWRFQNRRLRATSGRSCSLAYRLFFIAETGLMDEVPDPEIADLNAGLAQLP